MGERTDEDRAHVAPIVITLGGEPFSVRPLTLKKSRAWKRDLALLLGDLGGLQVNMTGADGAFSLDAVKGAFDAVAIAVPEKLAALVLSYIQASDPSADRTVEWFEDLANDREVTDALMQLVEVTFPFLWKLGDLAKVSGALAR